jgi:hypothetical protein
VKYLWEYKLFFDLIFVVDRSSSREKFWLTLIHPPLIAFSGASRRGTGKSRSTSRARRRRSTRRRQVTVRSRGATGMSRSTSRAHSHYFYCRLDPNENGMDPCIIEMSVNMLQYSYHFYVMLFLPGECYACKRCGRFAAPCHRWIWKWLVGCSVWFVVRMNRSYIFHEIQLSFTNFIIEQFSFRIGRFGWETNFKFRKMRFFRKLCFMPLERFDVFSVVLCNIFIGK